MIANSLADLEAVRDVSRQNFHVEKVERASVADWGLSDGALQHSSKGFFSAVGVRSRDDAPADRVLLYQPQAAITGLLYSFHRGRQYFLIQARAEPGCVDEVQFGPTIQSTPANYMRLHGGSGSPYADAFIAYDPCVTLVSDTTQSDLGERYLMKSKRLIVAEYKGEMVAHPGFVWASASAIRQAIARSTFLNIDLRGLLALADWTGREGLASLTPASSAAAFSLSRPVRADKLGALFANLRPRIAGYDTVPLENLRNWCLDEWRLSEVEPRQGFAVEFFKVNAALREVSSWTEPLVNSDGQGHCALALRRSGEGVEVLVQIVRETGLAAGWGVGPTIQRYPGEAPGAAQAVVDRSGAPLVSTIESDEGGRFFKDESVYEIFLADGVGDLPSSDFHWINLAELKRLLNTSNVCTIQLRGLASQLLALEDS